MKLEYIEATKDDFEFFVHLHHSAYREIIEKMFGWDESLQDQFAKKAFDEGGMHFILYQSKKVGCVGWEEREDHLWLKEVFILPEFQGQGMGSQVIRDTKEKAKNKDIRLQTLKENLGAKRLYEHHGFEVWDSNKTHWQMVLKTKNSQKTK